MIIDDKLMKFVVFQKRATEEVREKCKKLNYTEEYIEEIIEYLTENGYLNDKKYVEKYISNVMRLKSSSIYELKIGLLKKGVNEDIIEEYINLNREEILDYEYESAKKVLVKKMRQINDIDKVKKYMMSRGYSYDSIKEGIDNYQKLEDNDSRN